LLLDSSSLGEWEEAYQVFQQDLLPLNPTVTATFPRPNNIWSLTGLLRVCKHLGNTTCVETTTTLLETAKQDADTEVIGSYCVANKTMVSQNLCSVLGWTSNDSNNGDDGENGNDDEQKRLAMAAVIGASLLIAAVAGIAIFIRRRGLKVKMHKSRLLASQLLDDQH
jgi:hypothetical protein